MKNNKKQEEGLLSKNGVCFDGDILLKYGRYHSSGSYLVMKIILAWLATFSTVSMGASFINYKADMVALAFTACISVMAVSLLNSKYNIIKICAGIVGFIYLTDLYINREYVKNGFYLAIKMYLKKANIPSGSLGALTKVTGSEAITCLFFFFNMLVFIVSIGTSLACVFRIDFPLMFIFTFPIFEIGMYQGFEAPTLSVIGMMVSWITVLSIHIINHTTNKAGRKNTYAIHERSKTFFFTSNERKSEFYSLYIRYVSVLTAVVFGVIVIFSAITGFVRPESFKKTRVNLHHAIMKFEAGDIDSFLSDLSGGSKLYGVKTVGGTNGGELGNTEGISFNGATALKLNSPYFSNTLYLRGYTAGKYSNNNWTPIDDNEEIQKVKDSFSNIGFIPQDFSYLAFGSMSGEELRNEINITVKGASPKFLYAPYTAGYSVSPDINEMGSDADPYNDDYIRVNKSQTQYSLTFFNNINWTDALRHAPNSSLSRNLEIYYPDHYKAMKQYIEYVHDNYSEPDDIKGVDKVFNEIVDTYFDGDISYVTYNDAYWAIKEYFSDNNFKYELMPGATPNGEDFIDYFLTKQKKGYCSYYASAGVELMRKFGFPSRYVEGYMVLPSQLPNISDANNRYDISVPDKCAHAWAEIFMDDIGWVPVEFTPGYINDNPNLDAADKTQNSSSSSIDESSSEESSETSSETESDVSDESESSKAESSSAAESKSQTGEIHRPTGLGNSSKSNSKHGTAAKTDSSNSDGEGDGFSPFTKTLMITIPGIVIIAMGLVVNRKHRLRQMRLKCSHQDTSERVLNIYRYTLKYLALLHIEIKRNISDLQLCDEIISKCHEKNITQLDDKLTELSLIAVKAYMSNGGITEEEADKAEETLNYIRNYLVAGELNGIEKISAKYLYCLY